MRSTNSLYNCNLRSDTTLVPSDPEAVIQLLRGYAASRGDAANWGAYYFALCVKNPLLVPAQLAAVFEALSRSPAVDLLGPIRDPLGRSGIAISSSLPGHGTWVSVYDPRTSRLLAEGSRNPRVNGGRPTWVWAFTVNSAPARGLFETAAGGATSKRFTSTRYEYSIALPTRWMATRATVSLTKGYFPTTNKPFSDVLAGPDPPGHFVVGAARKLRNGTTLQAWTAEMGRSLEYSFGCSKPARATGSLGGVRATVVTHDPCSGSSFYYIGYTALHAGRGFIVYWISETGYERRDRARFARIIETFRFTR